MSYQEQLSPWVVHKLTPDLKQAIVARFRHRNDAEAYMKIVKRMMPYARFAIAFEIQGPSCKVPTASSTASKALA